MAVEEETWLGCLGWTLKTLAMLALLLVVAWTALNLLSHLTK